MNNRIRKKILDISVDAINMDDSLNFIDKHIKNDSKIGYILAINPEKIYILRQDLFLKEFFKNALLLIPDGIGIVMALKFLYGVNISRVPGADLMQNICRVAPERKYKIFIYGGSEDVNLSAVKELKKRNPGINIVGRINGYVPSTENEALIKQINESKANILFIALGSPSQEKWLSENIDKLAYIKICQGIGGTLDTITGDVKRAPMIFQKLCLEWFYRLLKQPSRIFRQLKLLHFVWEVLIEKIKLIFKKVD